MNRNCRNPLPTSQTPPRTPFITPILSPSPRFSLPLSPHTSSALYFALPSRVQQPLPAASRIPSPAAAPPRWQQKRNTLPSVASQPLLEKLISPERRERQARISFSYNDQQGQQVRMELRGERTVTGRRKEEEKEQRDMWRWKKQMRNRLDSLVYSHVILPQVSPTPALLNARSPFSSVGKRADSSRISRMASTEASYVLNPDRPTFQPGTLQFSSRKRLSQQCRPPTQLEQMPAKVLNKTILINSDSYFGAVLGSPPGEYSTNNSLPSQREVGASRGWKSYVKCLLSEGDDLKHSIHCGPQIRHVNLRYDFLGGLGREIKASEVRGE